MSKSFKHYHISLQGSSNIIPSEIAVNIIIANMKMRDMLDSLYLLYGLYPLKAEEGVIYLSDGGRIQRTSCQGNCFSQNKHAV